MVGLKRHEREWEGGFVAWDWGNGGEVGGKRGVWKGDGERKMDSLKDGEDGRVRRNDSKEIHDSTHTNKPTPPPHPQQPPHSPRPQRRIRHPRPPHVPPAENKRAEHAGEEDLKGLHGRAVGGVGFEQAGGDGHESGEELG